MRSFSLALIVFGLLCDAAFAQTPLSGKWSTAAGRPEAAAVSGAAQGANRGSGVMPERTVDPVTGRVTIPNPLDPTGRSKLVMVRPEDMPAARPPVSLDFTAEGNRISGTINDAGRAGLLTIEEGVLTGKIFTFNTNRILPRGKETVLWKGEIVDAETIVLVPTLLRSDSANSTGMNPIRGGAPSRGQAVGFPGAPRSAPPEDVKTVGGSLVLRRVQ